MRQDNQVQNTLQRLLSVKWKADPTRFKSHNALLNEYFRRSSLWAKAFDAPNDWPIIDIASHIDSTIHIDKTVIQVWHEHLSHLSKDNRMPSEMEWLLEAALRWPPVEANQLTDHFKLPKPYEPIVVMDERGGFFYRSHEGIEITFVTTMSYRSWQAYDKDVPYDSIEVSELDKIDFGGS
jgi:hypothetical protein